MFYCTGYQKTVKIHLISGALFVFKNAVMQCFGFECFNCIYIFNVLDDHVKFFNTTYKKHIFIKNMFSVTICKNDKVFSQ